MICQNTIREYNSQRDCWLPVSPCSPFHFCVRCDFKKIEEILHKPSCLSEYFENPQFLQLVQEKQHHHSLLNALSFLCKHQANFFQKFFLALQSDSFQNFLSHLIYTHTSFSQSCSLYQYSLTHRKTQDAMRYTELPWRCWTCLAKILRSKHLAWYRAFSNGLIRNKLHEPHLHKDEILDCMVSLKLIHKDYTARILFERYRQTVKNEEAAKQVLQEFLCQPCMLGDLLLNKSEATEFIPVAWNSKEFIQDTQKKGLKFVKKHYYVYKEDLMIKTWAPHRLFTWGFDIEELKDFEPI